MRRRASQRTYLTPEEREEQRRFAQQLTSSPVTPKAKRFHFQIESSPLQPPPANPQVVFNIDSSPLPTNRKMAPCNKTMIIPKIEIQPPTQTLPARPSRRSLTFTHLFNKTATPAKNTFNFDAAFVNISPYKSPQRKRELLEYPLEFDIEVTPTKRDTHANDSYKKVVSNIQSTPNSQQSPPMKPIEIDTEDSPIANITRKDDSHWFQDSAKKRKMRGRKSLNETAFDSFDSKKPLVNKLYQTLKAKIERSSNQRYTYINSLSLPVDQIDPIFQAKRQFRPTLDVFVTSVTKLSFPQTFLQIDILTTTARDSKDIFYSLGERATLILEKKIFHGMGIEAGTTLRFTYPMYWSRVGPQKGLIISNVFWMEAIKRDEPVMSDYENLFTFDCPCQPNAKACRIVPLCSSSQCDGNFPVGEDPCI